jgi:tRNA-dihydrouridine synthase C
MEREPSAAEWPTVLGYLADYLRKLHARISAKHEHGRVKLWLGYLKRTWPQAAELHDAIRRLQHPEEIQNAIEQALDQIGRQSAPAG